jgi:hypothetical protein
LQPQLAFFLAASLVSFEVILVADALSLGLGGGLIAFGIGAWLLCRKKADAIENEISQAKSWPQIDGIVTRSQLINVKTTAGVYPSVHYRFELGGTTYDSARMFFGGFTGTRAEAEAFVAERPVGAKVAIYCDPNKPKSAVLVPSGDGKIWRQNGIWFGATFGLIGLIIAATGSG